MLRKALLAAVIILAVVAAWWGVATYRGVVAGQRDPLVARIANSAWVKDHVRQWFHVEYSFTSLHVGVDLECGWRVNINDAKLTIPGVIHVSSKAGQLCGLLVSGRDVILGSNAETPLFTAASAWSRGLIGDAGANGIAWTPAGGQKLVTIADTSLRGASQAVTNGIVVAPGQGDREIAVDQSAASGLELTPKLIRIGSVQGSSIRLRLVEQPDRHWNLEQLLPLFLAGRDELLVLARGVYNFADERLINLKRWVGWLPWLPWIAAAILVALAVLFARDFRWWHIVFPALALLATFPALRARDFLRALQLGEFPVVPSAISIQSATAENITAGIKLTACAGTNTAVVRIASAKAAQIEMAAFQSAEARGTVSSQLLDSRLQPVAFHAQLESNRFRADISNRDGRATVAGSGDVNEVRLDSLTAEANAGYYVRSGRGTVKLDPKVDARLTLSDMGGPGATVARANVGAQLPGVCRSGPSAFAVSAGDIRYAGSGVDLIIATVETNAKRPTLGQIELNASIAGIATKFAQGSATVPRLQFDVQGAVANDPLPRWFRGSVKLAALRTDGSKIFEPPSPVQIDANYDRGALDVRGELGSFATQAGPLDLALNRVGASVQWQRTTGLNWTVDTAGRARFPNGLPVPLTPRTLTSDELHITGSASLFPAGDDLRADADALSAWAQRAIPSFGDELGFSATANGHERGPVNFQLQSSGGAVIKGAAEAALQRLEAPEARFQLLEADAHLRALTTGSHGGNINLDLATKLDTRGARTQFSGAFAGSVTSTPGELSATLTGPLRADPALPFLREAGIDLDGIDLPGNAEGVTINARHTTGRITDWAADFTVGSGPLARVDFRKLGARRFLESATVSADSPLKFHFDSLGVLRAEAGSITAEVNKGALATHLDGAWNATLTNGPLADYSWLRKPAEWAAELRGTQGFEAAPLNWDARLRDVNVGLDDSRIAVKLGSSSVQVDARNASANGDISLDALFYPYSDYLIVDVRALSRALRVTAMGNTRVLGFDQPVLLVLGDRLRPATDPARMLFDTPFYTDLWTALPKRFPAPLFAAIGFRDRLQVHAPIPEQRLLFGTAHGLVGQVSLDLRANPFLADAAAEGLFAGLQLGALGGPTGRGPLIDDAIDGSAWFRANALPLDRALLTRVLSDASSVTELDRLSFRINATRSQNPALPTGVLLIHTNLRTKLQNPILQQVAIALQGLTPRQDALRYRDMQFLFEVQNGNIVTANPLLTLSGVTAIQSSPVEVQLRLLWGRQPGFDGLPLRLRNVVFHLQPFMQPLLRPRN